MKLFRERRVHEIGLIAIRDVSPPFSAAMEYYRESLQMDSEGRIIEVVLGTECSDYDRRKGDNKQGIKLVQVVRTEIRSKR